jgi:hypothetical protein
MSGYLSVVFRIVTQGRKTFHHTYVPPYHRASEQRHCKNRYCPSPSSTSPFSAHENQDHDEKCQTLGFSNFRKIEYSSYLDCAESRLFHGPSLLTRDWQHLRHKKDLGGGYLHLVRPGTRKATTVLLCLVFSPVIEAFLSFLN